MNTNLRVKAIRIYNANPSKPNDIRAVALMSDGVLEHYNWDMSTSRNMLLNGIDKDTYIYDERIPLSWSDFCSAYGVTME